GQMSPTTKPHVGTTRMLLVRRSRIFSLRVCGADWLQDVASMSQVVCIHARKFSNAAPFWCANDEHHQVNRLDHEAWLRGHAGFLDEGVEAQEGRRCAVGVYSRDPARVPGVPGLQQCQGLP